MTYPIIISFFTLGTGYEALAEDLRESCHAFRLDHDIEAVVCDEAWVEVCARKAAFVREKVILHGDVCWVDADAVIKQPPKLLRELDCDIAFNRTGHCNSGTVFARRSALNTLDKWVSLCEQRPDVPDQRHLDTAVKTTDCRLHLLPVEYCWIYDTTARNHPSRQPVIEHRQASRFARRPDKAKGRSDIHPSVLAAFG